MSTSCASNFHQRILYEDVHIVDAINGQTNYQVSEIITSEGHRKKSFINAWAIAGGSDVHCIVRIYT